MNKWIQFHESWGKSKVADSSSQQLEISEMHNRQVTLWAEQLKNRILISVVGT